MKLNNICKKIVLIGMLFIFNSISFAECDHDYSWAPSGNNHYYACEKCGNIAKLGTHTYSDAKSATTHYEACTECGHIRNQEAHSFETAKSATTHYESCSECGYIKNQEAHSFETAKSATTHYESCSECGYIRNQEAHSFETAKSATTHYESCSECGYIKNQEAHSFETAKSATTHYESCSECGYIRNQEAHSFETAKSATTHYESCSECGYIRNQEAHSFETAKSATTHYESCSKCGYIKNQEAHSFETAKSATTHYESCSKCGYIKNQEAHSFETAKSSTTHYESCRKCGYIRNQESHTFAWSKSETTHYEACTECGYIRNQGSHTYSGNTCTVCGYEKDCEHTFETAKSATNHYEACSKCGYIKNQEAHSFETAKSSTTHYESCSKCGYIRNQESHTFAWSKSETTHYEACTECGYIRNQGSHTYSGNTCTVCGYEKDCEHTFETAKSATNHYEACSKCGYIKNQEAHSFETAKSSTTHYESCSKCGYIRNQENHSFEWVKTATTHYEICSKCDYKRNEGNHTFTNNKCTVCGYEKVDVNSDTVIKASPASGAIMEENDKVTLTIEDADGIDYIEYKWGSDSSYTKVEKNGETKTAVETTAIGNKVGTHTLTVRVKDSKGATSETVTFKYIVEDKTCVHTPSGWKYNSTYHWKVCTKCEEYVETKQKHTYKNDECTVCGYEKDSTNDDTDISVSPKSGSYVSYGDRIKITAEDDDGIDYVEYYWNDDDSSKKYSDEFTVKVPSEEGKNYLYVRAEDEKGNRCSYERFTFYVEEDYYPGNSDNQGELNKAIKDLRVEIGNVDDKIVYEPGEEIEYYINYYNGTSSKISNVKIVVEVPNTNFKMVDVENNGTKTTKKATWNLGTLKSGDDGRVYFTMKYDSKKLDNDLIFNVEAKIYKSSKEQDTSFTRNMIYNEDSNKQDSHDAYASGYPDGRFKPDGTITRAEMATMIARMAGINVDTYTYNNAFADVSADFWAAGAIQACVDNGLVGAYSYNRFEPELPATRGMISYAIAKILDVEDVEPIYIRAKDTENSSAKIPVEQMLRLNIIDGYSNGTAKPDKYITRAEAVVIINKYLFRGELLSDGSNLGYYGPQANGLRQFTDLYYGHWAYDHIMEATCNHDYVRTYDGNETLVK